MPPLALPFPNFDPVLFQIGPLEIRWYALAYIVGILGGWVYARAIIRSEPLWGGKPPLTVIDFDDFIMWVTIAIILGGRVGYVLFYNPAFFFAHPGEILKLWNGGMSFHGGFLGCVIAVIAFARYRGISILSLGDIVCAVAPIGLFLGRIANFINAELWGRTTDSVFGVVFCNARIQAANKGICPAGLLPRHPSQLYEAALEGIVLFIVLAVMMRAGALKRPGTILGAFCLGYGLARTTCEFFREPDVQLGFLWGGLTMGMLLSLPLIIAGVILIVAARRTEQLQQA
jgi:phosphatidylglycerol:prolipoprotein diacylglycerol transferase